jgi:hypothetical protein
LFIVYQSSLILGSPKNVPTCTIGPKLEVSWLSAV